MEDFKQDAPDVRVFEAGLSDAVTGTLIEMSAEWEAETSCHGYRKNTEEDIAGNRVFLAFSEGKTVGYVFGHHEKTDRATSVIPEGAAVFEVEEIYVRPEYRNAGIGRKLFTFAENAVRGEADYITLSTATKNWRAILHFYIDELGMDFWSARLFKKTGGK